LFLKQKRLRLLKMKRPPTHDIVHSILTALHEATGIAADFHPSQQRSTEGEVQLRRGDTTAVFSAELRTTVRRGHLALVVESMKRRAQPSILLTHHVTQPLAQELAQQGVNFADASGNAYIDHHDWFIFTAGRPAPPSASPSPLTVSTWKVAFALLRTPDLQGATVRDLAAQAGVSPGATTKAIQALDARGWVSNHGHQRLLLQPEALWRAWEGGWVDRLAAKLFITRASAPSHSTLQEWGDLASGVEHVLIGGELAAERLGTGIVAESATLHVHDWNATTMAQVRLVPDDRGTITIRQRFGTLDEDLHHNGHAHPILVRADLITVVDERLDATRHQLAEQIQRALPDAS
jgi:hypothetical protein